MLTVKLPKYLQDEFERSARLLYDRDGVTRALAEAIELWLAQRRDSLVEAEQAIDDRAYEALRPELERDHWGEWIVIAHGKLQGIGPTLDEVVSLASEAPDRILMQIGEDRPKEIELGWQMTFV